MCAESKAMNGRNYIQYFRPIMYALNGMKPIPITILPIHYTTPDHRLGLLSLFVSCHSHIV